jgi:hypothetical protein
VLTSLGFLVVIIAGAILFSRWFDHYLQWREHHYLYRVKCEVHDAVLGEFSEEPNIDAFFCVLCTWRAEGNIVLERFDITRFSRWERIE